MEDTVVHALNQLLFTMGLAPRDEEAIALADSISKHWDKNPNKKYDVLFRWDIYTKTFECEPLGGM